MFDRISYVLHMRISISISDDDEVVNCLDKIIYL